MPGLLTTIAQLPALFGNGCDPARVVNALVSPDQFRFLPDQRYGDDPRQTLDVYRPANDDGHPKPVVVFFYGGKWQSGAKSDYLFVGEALASRGFIAVIPDYRLYPQAHYPEFIEDGAAAVSYTLQHAAEWGGDPQRISVAGHSAGAYIATMLGLDAEFLGRDRARIAGIVGLAGPYDFLPLTDPVLQEIFGTAADLTLTEPIRHVDGTAPPMLLVTGLGDKVISPRNVASLASRIREKGGTVETRAYRRIGHVTLIGAVALPFRFLAPVLDDLTAFLANDAARL
ncbi:MAG: carboxylesterase [Rhodospirillales bacterium]|nr:carboxylesterase [Rhodospirillales bacterium]